MAKDPYKLVDDIDTAQNVEDRGLPKRAAKALLNVVKPKATKPDTGETTNIMGDKYAKGGSVSSASKRADGCCIRGKTKA
jgi:hypothetical protein